MWRMVLRTKEELVAGLELKALLDGFEFVRSNYFGGVLYKNVKGDRMLVRKFEGQIEAYRKEARICLTQF